LVAHQSRISQLLLVPGKNWHLPTACPPVCSGHTTSWGS
jgi:hypothetical protein